MMDIELGMVEVEDKKESNVYIIDKETSEYGYKDRRLVMKKRRMVKMNMGRKLKKTKKTKKTKHYR
jgi:hypothetical protein